MMRIIYFFLLSVFALSCANQQVNKEKQYSFISNFESNNSDEYDHVYFKKVSNDTLFFSNRINGLLEQINNKSWIIGQGTGKKYFNTGKEVLFKVKKICQEQHYVIISNPSLIKKDRPVVFWKINTSSRSWINLDRSWAFSQIIFDSIQQCYFTHVYRCNSDSFDIYTASSKTLDNWTVSPKATLHSKSFNSTRWNFPKTSCPKISSIVYHKNKFYSYSYSDDSNNKTYISVLLSDSINGKYCIPNDPCLTPNPESKYSNHDVYFPSVIQVKEKWLMFYTSKNKQSEEFICIAESRDLINWKTISENVVPRNRGWNSSLLNQMVSQVEYKNDTIWLWATGVKEYSNSAKGNVLDMSIGKFYATDLTRPFIAIKGNPIFSGSPNLTDENDHIGASFQELRRNDTTFTFYISKGIKDQDYKLRRMINF